MTLYAGRGPLSRDPAGQFFPAIPAEVVFIEPHPRRVQAVLNGHTVIDTESALLVHRRDHPLSYAFPAAVIAGLPAEPVPERPGYVRVPWDAVDSWIEEGRVLVHYPPNPYHRVDCLPTNRGLRVSIAGTVLVDTADTVVVYETSLAARLYVDPAAVRTDLLRRSETTSYCNYKGHATYWSAVIGDRGGAAVVVEDIAWSYLDSLPESIAIKGFLSFDDTKADIIAELPDGAGGDCGCDT
jgi:uncharacterized protein (DUF427 family)